MKHVAFSNSRCILCVTSATAVAGSFGCWFEENTQPRDCSGCWQSPTRSRRLQSRSFPSMFLANLLSCLLLLKVVLPLTSVYYIFCHDQVSVATDDTSRNIPDPSSVVSSSSLTPSSTSSSSSSSSSSPSSPENTLHRSSSLAKGACESDHSNEAPPVTTGPAHALTTIGRFQVSTSTSTTSEPAPSSKVGRFSVTGVYTCQEVFKSTVHMGIPVSAYCLKFVIVISLIQHSSVSFVAL